MPIDGWMDKEDALYIHEGMFLSHQKNEPVPSAATWMDLGIIILSEVSQNDMISLICGI